MSSSPIKKNKVEKATALKSSFCANKQNRLEELFETWKTQFADKPEYFTCQDFIDDNCKLIEKRRGWDSVWRCTDSYGSFRVWKKNLITGICDEDPQYRLSSTD